MNAVLSSEPPRGCLQHTGLGRGEGSRGVGVLPSGGLGPDDWPVCWPLARPAQLSPAGPLWGVRPKTRKPGLLTEPGLGRVAVVGHPGQSDRNLLSACRVVGAGCVPGCFPWRQLSVLAVCSVSADSGKAALWPFLPVLPPC